MTREVYKGYAFDYQIEGDNITIRSLNIYVDGTLKKDTKSIVYNAPIFDNPEVTKEHEEFLVFKDYASRFARKIKWNSYR